MNMDKKCLQREGHFKEERHKGRGKKQNNSRGSIYPGGDEAVAIGALRCEEGDKSACRGMLQEEEGKREEEIRPERE